MFHFAFSSILFMVLAAAGAVFLYLFTLRRAGRNANTSRGQTGLKMGYILCAAGSLCLGSSILLLLVVRSKVEGVFFLFHSTATNRSEAYRVYAVLMCIAGLAILGMGLVKIYYAIRKKEPS